MVNFICALVGSDAV